MKKSTILLSMLAAAVWLHGCTDGPEGARDNSPPATIDIASAREAFVRDYTAAIETRSAAQSDQRHYTLADTDFTPLWEEARQSENEHVTCLEVPILAATLCVSSEDGGKNFFPMAQRLLFVQPKGSQDIHSYLITLAFAPEYRQRFGCNDHHFHHIAGGEVFSGLAIYTDLGGRPNLIKKYRNGICTDRLSIVGLSASDSPDTDKIEQIFAGTSLYLASAPVTRGGWSDWFFEGLCENCLNDKVDTGCPCDGPCPFCMHIPCVCNICPDCADPYCGGCKPLCPDCGKYLDRCGCN